MLYIHNSTPWRTLSSEKRKFAQTIFLFSYFNEKIYKNSLLVVRNQNIPFDGCQKPSGSKTNGASQKPEPLNSQKHSDNARNSAKADENISTFTMRNSRRENAMVKMRPICTKGTIPMQHATHHRTEQIDQRVCKNKQR